MPADDPLTDKEKAFRLAIRADGVDEKGRTKYLSLPAKYVAWAELSRKSWTAKRASATPDESVQPTRKRKP